MYIHSPLRYPGGKGRVASFLRVVVGLNGLVGGTYVEPFAGGATVALELLFGGVVARAEINDADPAIHAFWSAVLNSTDRLCESIESVELSVPEWQRQRKTYMAGGPDSFDLGFATFYLNRTNRSGIIKTAGVIGGKAQTGPYKIDARFNRQDLVKRIRKVAAHRARIGLHCEDAGPWLKELAPTLSEHSLLYLDPPYFLKGRELYANFYKPADHAALASAVAELRLPWVVSYDDVPQIRALYEFAPRMAYDLRYTAAGRRSGSEVMFFSPGLKVPPVAKRIGPIRALMLTHRI